MGGSQSHASGRHSFTLGSFSSAKGDYSGAINVLGEDCLAQNDNELMLCAESVTIRTSAGDYDLISAARRLLIEHDSRDAEIKKMHEEIDLLRDQLALYGRDIMQS